MIHRPTFAAVAAATLAAAPAYPQDAKRLSWDGTLELGVDTVVASDTPGSELTDTYLVLDLAAQFALSERASLFAALTAESVIAAVDDRAFEDIGL